MRLKRLPLTLAGLHAAWICLLFGAAIHDMERAGLAPVFAFYSDYPLSVFMDWLRHQIPNHDLLTDGAIFLIFGSPWFYLIGWCIRWGVNKTLSWKAQPTEDRGTCEHCGEGFSYRLIHNGFNDSAYAYSDTTCYTCLLDGWTPAPPGVTLDIQKKITPDIEEHLVPAPDGGLFRASAVPRCPHCNEPLDPMKAATYIERNAEGTKGGWRWRQSWDGIYSIIIEGRMVQNNWKTNA